MNILPTTPFGRTMFHAATGALLAGSASRSISGMAAGALLYPNLPRVLTKRERIITTIAFTCITSTAHYFLSGRNPLIPFAIGAISVCRMYNWGGSVDVIPIGMFGLAGAYVSDIILRYS